MTEPLESPRVRIAMPHADAPASIQPVPTSQHTGHDSHTMSNLYDSPPKSQPTLKAGEAVSKRSHSPDHVLTPPHSAISSQEDHQLSRGSPESQLHDLLEITSDGSHTSKEPSRASTNSPTQKDGEAVVWSGPKRTASGQVKRSSMTSLNDLKPETTATRPSRTSTASSGSVMDVSVQSYL